MALGPVPRPVAEAEPAILADHRGDRPHAGHDVAPAGRGGGAFDQRVVDVGQDKADPLQPPRRAFGKGPHRGILASGTVKSFPSDALCASAAHIGNGTAPDQRGAAEGQPMQTQNRFFDDLARVAAGAFGTLSGVKGEVESRLREQLERVLAGMDLVSREEFEAVKAMAAKARAEQEDLARRVALLESRLAAGAAGAPPPDPAGGQS